MSNELFEQVEGQVPATTAPGTDVPELIEVTRGSGLDEATYRHIEQAFIPFFTQVRGWKEKAAQLVVTDVSQTREMRMAREARLALKEIRVDADKQRKALKEDSLRYGRAVQGVYNIVEALIVPIEKHLEEQEKFAERMEAKLKEEARVAREATAEEEGLWEYIPRNLQLGELLEQDWLNLVGGARLQKQAAEAEARKKAEEEKQAAERAAALEARKKQLYDLKLSWNGSRYIYRDIFVLPTDLEALPEQEWAQLLEMIEGRKAQLEEEDRLAVEEARKQAEAVKAAEKAKKDAEKKAKEAAAKAEADKKAAEAAQKAADEARKEAEAKVKAAEEAAQKAQEEAARAKAREAAAEEMAKKAAEAAASQEPGKDWYEGCTGDQQRMTRLLKFLEKLPMPVCENEEAQLVVGAVDTRVKAAMAHIRNHIDTSYGQTTKTGH